MCHRVFAGGSVQYAYTTIPTYPRSWRACSCLLGSCCDHLVSIFARVFSCQLIYQEAELQRPMSCCDRLCYQLTGSYLCRAAGKLAS